MSGKLSARRIPAIRGRGPTPNQREVSRAVARRVRGMLLDCDAPRFHETDTMAERVASHAAETAVVRCDWGTIERWVVLYHPPQTTMERSS